MNISTNNSPTTNRFSLFKCLPVLFLLAFANIAAGQTVLKYVPSNADMVMTINLQNLDKKVNLEQLRQYDFYQALMKEMVKSPQFEDNPKIQAFFEKMLTAPASIGFDTNEPIVVFVEKVGYDTYTTIVSKLGDKAVYEAAVNELVGEYFKPFDEQPEGMNIWHEGDNIFAWNDEVVVEVKWEKGYNPNEYDWGYDEPELADSGFVWREVPNDFVIDENTEWHELNSDTTEEEEVDFDSLDWPAETAPTDMADTLPAGTFQFTPEEGESVIFGDFEEGFNWVEEPDTAGFAWAKKVLSRQFLQPITRNERFAQAKGRSNDVHFWIDYGFINQFSENGQWVGYPPASALPQNGMSQALSAMGGMMDVFYGDTYLSMGLNFEDGRMAIRSQLFFNEDMKRFYSRALDAKFNKKFLRYVKGGDEMFGYFYVNYNIKNTIEESKSLLYKIFDATPQYGEMAADMMKILGIFIDEEAVGNLLKGDLMVAVSGIQTVETTIQTYDYDQDFNFITKDTTVMKQVPIFTALASYGNGKDIQKFIDLGVHSKVLTPEGNYYRIVLPGMDAMDFFFAKHDGMLIFTNNPYLMRQNLEKGFAKKLRLPKNHKKRLCKSGSVAYWNIPNTIRAVAGSEADSNIGMMGYLNNIGKEFYSMEMTTDKKVGNAVETEIFLNMTAKGTNALQQFFNVVNDIFLESIGGAKI